MKKIFLATVTATLLLSTSCSDWTDPEAEDYSSPWPELQNPDQYAAYLASIRNYKLGAHKIMMIDVPAVSVKPNVQNQHPMMYPDSVDYICISGILSGLHPDVVAEFHEVLAAKGTRSLCVVDFSLIEEAWTSMEEARADAGEVPGTMEEFDDYCRKQTIRQLDCCDKYGLSGIEISYQNNTSTELKRVGQQAFLECVRAWRDTHTSKRMIFRGYAQNILHEFRPLLHDCHYIVYPCGSTSAANQLTVAINRMIRSNPDLPTDRFVLEVTLPTLEDSAQVGVTAETGAEWVIKPEEAFSKIGMSVLNAVDSYFQIDCNYKEIRRAIGIMNPINKQEDDEDIQ